VTGKRKTRKNKSVEKLSITRGKGCRKAVESVSINSGKVNYKKA